MRKKWKISQCKRGLGSLRIRIDISTIYKAYQMGRGENTGSTVPPHMTQNH